jgi:hypothetical protein
MHLPDSGGAGRGVRRYALAVLVNDLIDQTILLGLQSRHNEVALDILFKLIEALPGVIRGAY